MYYTSVLEQAALYQCLGTGCIIPVSWHYISVLAQAVLYQCLGTGCMHVSLISCKYYHNSFYSFVLMQSSNALEDLANQLHSVTKKRNVGRIIDKILDEHYPREARSVTLDDLLNWEMWQTFIKILSKNAIGLGVSSWLVSKSIDTSY